MLRNGSMALLGLVLLIGACGPTLAAEPTVFPAVREPAHETFEEYPNWTRTSPDGKWTAEGYGLDYSGSVKVFAEDGSSEWWVEYPSWETLGWFEGRLWPVGWAGKTESFLFTFLPAVDGFVPFMDGVWVHRLHVRGGQVTITLDAVDHDSYAFSLSPDGDKLAYVPPGPSPRKLFIRDLARGRERSTSLGERYDSAGGIIWSPDGSFLLVQTAIGYDWDEAAFSLIRADLSDLRQTLLVEDHPQEFGGDEWLDEHTLHLSDWTGNVWSLDTEDGDFRLVATPTPH